MLGVFNKSHEGYRQQGFQMCVAWLVYAQEDGKRGEREMEREEKEREYLRGRCGRDGA